MASSKKQRTNGSPKRRKPEEEHSKGFLTDEDIAGLLENQEFMEEVVVAITEDSEIMADVAEVVAESLEDAIKDDAAIRGKLIEGAMASPEFKKRIARKLVANLG